ncbi:MAG: class I SAM-dependent methyltransferase [Rubrivivax sp.]|nr:class I SAM-dependent methyltransferase [Rubrivivax sp.]
MAGAERRGRGRAAPAPRADHITWLHRGGPSSRWGNLGRWRGVPGEAYADACRALALAVGEAAGIVAGDSVLSLACGGGEELALWAEHFGAAAVMGLEVSPSLAAQARARAEAVHTSGELEVHCADARRIAGQVHGRFHRIVCVDALYHLGARAPLLRAARQRLFAGGSFTFTDLVLDDVPRAAAWRRLALRGGAALAGIAFGEVQDTAAGAARLEAAGFDEVHVQRLDAEVLDGFCAFAARQARRIGGAGRTTAAWRRVALTAWLIRTGREAGLGYALYSGRVTAAAGDRCGTEPGRAPPLEARGTTPAPARSAAPSARVTASADATALSSSGIPGCA